MNGELTEADWRDSIPDLESADDPLYAFQKPYPSDKTLPDRVWVYASKVMSTEWRAWDCIHEDRDGLAVLCQKEYGRVPIDVFPVSVLYNDLPEKYKLKFYEDYATRHDFY